MVNRYPLYSKADRALWMLGDIWQSTEKKDLAAPYYARIVRDYPLSPLVPEAKNRLKTLGAPVPQADPQAVAWMKAEQNAPRPRSSLVKRPLSLIHNGPGDELVESDAGTETLSGGDQTRTTGGKTTGIVATVTPGASGTTGTAESAPAPAEEAAPAPAAPATDEKPPAAAGGASTAAAAGQPANGTSAATAGTADAGQKADGATATGTAQSSDGTKADGTQPQDASQNSGNGDNQKESTSKKKKGLRKIIPW
jgi:hypothetical protein